MTSKGVACQGCIVWIVNEQNSIVNKSLYWWLDIQKSLLVMRQAQSFIPFEFNLCCYDIVTRTLFDHQNE